MSTSYTNCHTGAWCGLFLICIYIYIISCTAHVVIAPYEILGSFTCTMRVQINNGWISHVAVKIS